MKPSIVKTPHLFILSNTPIFSGGLAALLTELCSSDVIHILPFHAHQSLSQLYTQQDIIIFELAASSSFEMSLAKLSSIRKNAPNCKILAIGESLRSSAIEDLLQLGVNGYISRGDKLSTVNEAIQALKDGLHYLPAF